MDTHTHTHALSSGLNGGELNGRLAIGLGRNVSEHTSLSCGHIVHPIQPEAHRDLKGQLALLNLHSLKELFSIRLA